MMLEKPPARILVIQTASIGDVILSTPVLESLHHEFPGSAIDMLVKKGNESLFHGHPFLRKVLPWDKKNGKYRNYIKILRQIRREQYDLVINVQRFLSTGLMTLLSKAGFTTGFDKNPLSRFFDFRARHIIGEEGIHEIDRNLSLLGPVTGNRLRKVRLYPTMEDIESVNHLQDEPYICIAPASLWFTKQYAEEKWVDLISKMDGSFRVHLIGSKEDRDLCERVISKCSTPMARNLAGELTLLQTAALMQAARMNFVNDSAPLHLASAVNAPQTAIFCSTVPEFGFGPLSDDSKVVETMKELKCRPCGLHGFKTCPEKHFECALTIDNKELLDRL